MKYTTKNPPQVDAIGFEELITEGVAQGVPIYNGLPWSFDYKEYHVTHENDDCYLVGACRFERGQFLVSGPGEITRVISAEDLAENYTPVQP
jgi:hypothetical protein